MKKEFEAIRCAANCRGCPFMILIHGQDNMYCSERPEGEQKVFPLCEDVTDCETRNSGIIHQLKMNQPKLGLGFVMTPLEGEEEGDCKVQLVGATGVLFEGILSELFPNDVYTALATVRIFDEQGTDRTEIVLKKALKRAYDETPETKHVFGGLKQGK